MVVPILYHPDYLTYVFGPEHPFSPIRLEMVLDLLKALDPSFDPISPPIATRADVLTVHSEAFVEQVEAAAQGTPRPDAAHYGLDTSDVPVFDGMDAAARSLVGGTLQAAQMVTSGAARRVLQLGGGLHHARYKEAAGFCVYNDLAVAIQHLRQQGFRVAYIDIDVHHGDGVQWIFYDDPGVLTISLHESGQYLFPGTGFVQELGEGAGKGTSLNVPLEPFTQDASYLDAFERVVPHALSWFHPDVFVVQCGADAHTRDPLAHLMLTTHAYETLVRRVLDLAASTADGRIVLTLGGGYNLDATARLWTMLALIAQDYDLPERLPDAWLDRWADRLGASLTPTLHDPAGAFSTPSRAEVEQKNRATSTRVLELAAAYW